MKFNFARFHQLVSFKIKEGLYAGFGYNYDSYFKIRMKSSGWLRETPC